MSRPGAKTPPLSTRKSSPLSQLFKLASLRSRKPPSATDEGGEKLQDFAPPEFPTADPDNTDDLPVAPSPSVFVLTPLSAAGNVGEEGAPTLSQAATHLALLEIFWKYKDRYLNPDDEVRAFFGAAFGWRQDRKWTSEDCEMLWRLVVEIAVGRFEAWWKIVGREMEAATWDKESTKAGHRWESKDGPSKAVSELPPDMLPPVDVLMVWHSFMLNPKCYYDDCFALGVPSMLSIAFPWETIQSAIHLGSPLSFALSAEAESFFRVSTLQHPDLFTQLGDASAATPRLPLLEIPCPSCGEEHEICITPTGLGTPGAQTGWQDPNFRLSCRCGFLIDHDTLCAERLRQDIKQVLSGGPGIRGTFSPPFARAANINTQLKQHYAASAPTIQSHQTVASLLEPLGKAAASITPFYLPASPQSSSCISLMSAVIRQAVFVDKMNHFLWLRSPSLVAGTLPRAQTKYRNYFALFKRFPGETMVPTLDVDLFWHSHQLTPSRYFDYCFSVAGRYIDHDDKLPTGILDDGFEQTCARYAEAFGAESEYGGCFCWPCELDRDDDEANTVEKTWDWRWNSGRRSAKMKEKRREWERRVVVSFWREVESRRRGSAAATAPLSLAGLQKVLAEGPKASPKKK